MRTEKKFNFIVATPGKLSSGQVPRSASSVPTHVDGTAFGMTTIYLYGLPSKIHHPCLTERETSGKPTRRDQHSSERSMSPSPRKVRERMPRGYMQRGDPQWIPGTQARCLEKLVKSG